jgi:hypothetical protein
MGINVLMNSGFRLAVLGVIAFASSAFAQDESQLANRATITVCYRPSNGNLRVASGWSTCGPGEQEAVLPVRPIVGLQGPQGARGPEGPIGLTGPTGDAGPVGPAGAQGPEGARGAQGARGAAGDQGTQGPAGPAGAKGLQGQQGPQGVQGAMSVEPGPQGPAGREGWVGPQGPSNDKGIYGYEQLWFSLPMGGAQGGEHTVVCREGRVPFGVAAVVWDTRVLGEKTHAFVDPYSKLVKVRWHNWDTYNKTIQVTLVCAWLD